MAEYLKALRQDTFTAPGNGVTQDIVNSPIKHFAIQVVGTGAVPTAWNVRLEGSLDNSNFTTILTHTEATGNGEILFSGANVYPVLYFRSRVVSLTLGLATNIVVSMVGYG